MNGDNKEEKQLVKILKVITLFYLISEPCGQIDSLISLTVKTIFFFWFNGWLKTHVEK